MKSITVGCSHHATSVPRLILVSKTMVHRLAESPCCSFNQVFSMIDLANLAKNSAVGIKRRTLRDQFELEI